MSINFKENNPSSDLFPYTYIPFQKDNRKVPLIVLFHGFMGSKEEWFPLTPSLGQHFNLLMIDLPWHGESSLIVESYDDLFNKLQSFLQNFFHQHHYSSSIFLGYSMGGRIALGLSLKAPHLCSHLILESAHPGIESAEEKIQRLNHDKKMFENVKNDDDFFQFLHRWYQQGLFGQFYQEQELTLKNKTDNYINKKFKLFQQHAHTSSRTISDYQQSLEILGQGTQPNYWPLLPQLEAYHISFHFLAGSDDVKYAKNARRIEKNYPFAKVHIIEHCGHNIHLQKSDVFSQLILMMFSR